MTWRAVYTTALGDERGGSGGVGGAGGAAGVPPGRSPHARDPPLRWRRRAGGRGLNSTTFQLNFSAVYGIGGSHGGCVARFKGVLEGVKGV
jgi:hypothetical protein